MHSNQKYKIMNEKVTGLDYKPDNTIFFPNKNENTKITID